MTSNTGGKPLQASSAASFVIPQFRLSHRHLKWRSFIKSFTLPLRLRPVAHCWASKSIRMNFPMADYVLCRQIPKVFRDEFGVKHDFISSIAPVQFINGLQDAFNVIDIIFIVGNLDTKELCATDCARYPNR